MPLARQSHLSVTLSPGHTHCKAVGRLTSPPLPAGLRELTLGMCGLPGASGAIESIRGLAQDLAALGHLTLLLAPPDVVAALPPALGGLVELRVRGHELDTLHINTRACPDMDMDAACLHVSQHVLMWARHVTTPIGEGAANFA